LKKRLSIWIIGIIMLTLFGVSIGVNAQQANEDNISNIRLIKDVDELPEGYEVLSIEEGKTVITSPSGVITSYQNYKTGDAIIRQSNSLEKMNFGSTEVVILGTVSIRGELDPNEEIVYGPYNANPGDNITVSVAWTPADHVLYVGICPIDKPWIALGYTGGAASVSREISQAGDYIIWLKSSSDNTDTLKYSGYITYP